MIKQTTTLDDLIFKATDYIKSQLNFSRSVIHKYTRSWKQLKEYMATNGITSYDQEVEKQMLNHLFRDKTKRELSDADRYFYAGIQKLTEFQKTGKIEVRHRPKYPWTFEGAIGSVMNQFLEDKRVEDCLSLHRLRLHKRNLFQFLNYCNEQKMHSIKDISLASVLAFICSIDGTKPSVIPFHISGLRCFIKYAFEKNHLPFDFSRKLPKYKLVREAKLPSVYSKEDIQKLLAAVERASSVGKRNYAVILIAARLGLRAFDIARLQFNNLHWDTSTLKITQSKTGKEIELPLLPDVGNAIIDYLKYGRPKSNESYLFLKERPPYVHFTTSGPITHIVQRAFIKAGIDIKNKKFGPHALRHTLAFRMLEASTILPVISEVLGHESSESAKYYLRIDLKSMQQCVLDVPPIPKAFYQQRGGAFYE